MQKQSKTIIAFFIAFCLIFSLGGCGDNNASSATSEGGTDAGSGSRRLDELRRQKAGETVSLTAEITQDEALLDEIVGEWGFVAPLWGGTVPAGFADTSDPLIRFYMFTESGYFTEFRTYIGLIGEITPLDYTGKFAVDEQNNTIYLVYDDDKSETELRYVFEDGNLKVYGGFYAVGPYNKDYETELFKANWEDLWSGIGQKDIDFIQSVINDNPDYVPDFFKQSKNATDNTQLANALVGQWGAITPGRSRKATLFCYDFAADGKVILTYTDPAENGTQKMDGVYLWNEAEKKITLAFNAESTDFSYSFDGGTFKLYGKFFDGDLFTYESSIELIKADWSNVCSDISEMDRDDRGDYLKEFLNEHPEYKPDSSSNN